MEFSSQFTEREPRDGSTFREYLEVFAVVVVVSTAGWFSSLDYHALGLIFLLSVILLCVRVGRGAVFFAVVSSALVWNFLFIPPRWSLAILHFNDGMLLLCYLAVALIAGRFTARIHEQERLARLREQQATAMYNLTHALAGSRTLDEAVAAALRQADELFKARTALLLGEQGSLQPHPAGSLQLDDTGRMIAEWVRQYGREAGRFTQENSAAEALYLPLLRSGAALGVLAIRVPAEVDSLSFEQYELMDDFAAQIALLVEREQLRAESECGKIFAESDRLHRTLLDSVSHELKTPLAVLRSAGEHLDTTDEKKRTTLVAEVQIATRRLDHLVANLLNQSRLESGGLNAQLDWCDARDLVTVARRAVGDALTDRPIQIEISKEMPLFKADAPLMEQVIANLLLNAALYTPAGSPIHVDVGLENHRDQVYFKISDRGRGIPEELRENLFQKFHRGSGARAGGLGLGLSIVRGFMLAQGGEVEVDNNPDGGACFTLRLPLTAHSKVPNDEN